MGPRRPSPRGGALLAADSGFAEDVTFPIEATVQVRARHAGVAATLSAPDERGEVRVRFAEPVRAVSPGQVAVAYHGTRVLGGGTILRAER